MEKFKRIINHDDLKLNIPDAVIDRAHRIGPRKENSPPTVICRFTTWRHRTAVYRNHAEINKMDRNIKVFLDITRENLSLMNDLRKDIDDAVEAKNAVEYVFADVNCQPMIKFRNGKFKRFNTLVEGQDTSAQEIRLTSPRQPRIRATIIPGEDGEIGSGGNGDKGGNEALVNGGGAAIIED